MKKIDLKKVMGWLGFILRCPVCGYKYNLANTKIIESEQDVYLSVLEEQMEKERNITINVNS